MEDFDPAAHVVDRQFFERRNWPVADSGKVSIFEAVEIVGRSHFDEQWSGGELRSTWWSETEHDFRNHIASLPPHSEEATDLDRRRARQLGISVEKWMERGMAADRRRADEHRLWISNMESFQRLEWAVGQLAQRCRDGVVRSYWRPRNGGALKPMEPHDWNVENPMVRFLACGGNESVCHDRMIARYVFFERDDLTEANTVSLNDCELAIGQGSVAITSSVHAVGECRKWLAQAFADVSTKNWKKADFQSAALEKFSGRLSVRGFVRAWDAVAPDAGRSKPGRKS